MHINFAFKNYSFKNRDLVHILILLTIALVVGLYLIITTVVVAKDGITFIRFAQDIEIDVAKTMIEQDQHPAYPVMIQAAHKIVKLFIDGQSVFSWLYSAQIVALIFRLSAIIALYFIGKNLVGAKLSFLALLILIFLPKPAGYGSDALSDWPHIFFLVIAMLLLIHAAISEKWWLFGLAGLVSGTGYLFRPECIQVVVYGLLWLTLQLFWSRHITGKGKSALAMILLIVGFCVVAGPYMKLKGAVFPKKNIGQFTQNLQQQEIHKENEQLTSKAILTSQFTPTKIIKALEKLFSNIGETLMWFFIPALFIGIYKSFRESNWYKPLRFFIIAFVGSNVALMVLLYFKAGYISDRHTLPLIVFTIFYIPEGMYVLADLLNNKVLKKDNAHLGFVILMVTGIAICSPKLFRPLHHDKVIFRKAAHWLAENTQPSDVIAVPDLRISFYANRNGADYKHNPFPENAQYAVKVSEGKIHLGSENLCEEGNCLYTSKAGQYQIYICKLLN